MTQGYPSRTRIHPHKFALWVACAGIVMMFTALTSAYIVRKAAGNWLEFELPNIFYWNTLVILTSSLTLHSAYLAFQRGWAKAYASLLGATLLLGLVFLGLQYEGWQAMVEQGIPLKTNPSGDFIYVISGIHGAHVLGGLAALAVSFGLALLRPFRQTPVRKLRLELVLTYWHFVDFLWLYLLIFWVIQG